MGAGLARSLRYRRIHAKYRRHQRIDRRRRRRRPGSCCRAFDKQWNRDLKAIWGVDAASFAFVPRGQAPAAGNWWVVFLDDSDQARALAYHDLTNDGLPMSKVFVRSVLDDKASISVAATHEICEMAVDPWLNSAYQDATGVFWAGEVCDPVEDDEYGYKIGDVLVTDFVTPNWFGHLHAREPDGSAEPR